MDFQKAESVSQCVAVCCSVLQCVAADENEELWVRVRCSVLQCIAVCCGVLQCVAVCCSALHYVAVCCRNSWNLDFGKACSTQNPKVSNNY